MCRRSFRPSFVPFRLRARARVLHHRQPRRSAFNDDRVHSKRVVKIILSGINRRYGGWASRDGGWRYTTDSFRSFYRRRIIKPSSLFIINERGGGSFGRVRARGLGEPKSTRRKKIITLPDPSATPAMRGVRVLGTKNSSHFCVATTRPRDFSVYSKVYAFVYRKMAVYLFLVNARDAFPPLPHRLKHANTPTPSANVAFRFAKGEKSKTIPKNARS